VSNLRFSRQDRFITSISFVATKATAKEVRGEPATIAGSAMR
jgi:hypothetical protein